MKVETEPGRGPSQESSHEPAASSEKSSSIDSSRTRGTIGNTAEVSFIDGSRYQGTWDALGMAGFGSFRMPHGVLYEGHFEDGMHQGEGRLEWPGKQVIHGEWNRGEMIEWRYTFADGLSYQPQNWTYCRFPERRFNRSIISGLNPAGKSLETENQPTKVIPPECYDSGDGVFDPSTLCVTNFEKPSKVIRIPKGEEIDWITSNCRKGEIEPVGYRPELNENWSENPPELPYRLAMSTDSPERWWKRIFTFERDTSLPQDQISSPATRPFNDETSELSTTASSAAECRCYTETTSFDVCGDDSSSSISEVFRRVICEPMSSDDYEGEQVEDLSMTVCVPPTGTYTVIRRKPRSTKSFETQVEVEVEVESSEEDTQDEEELEEELEEEEEEEEEIPEKESERKWGEVLESYEGSPEESIAGEDDSVASRRSRVFGKEFVEDPGVESIEEIERMRIPGREKRTKGIRRVGSKKQKKNNKSTTKKKQRCPSGIDGDQLLQRKVGDLLFSPALEAPRSPVHMVRKECDREICNFPKYESSKCGVPHTARRQKPKICTDEKKTKSSEMGKICVSSKLFVTTDDV